MNFDIAIIGKNIKNIFINIHFLQKIYYCSARLKN